MTGVKHNGVTVSVQKWSDHKKPVLAVQFDDENAIYKIRKKYLSLLPQLWR